MGMFTRFVLTAFLLVAMSLQTVAQNPSCKVYKREGDKYYLGKLYIPKGAGKLKLKHFPTNDALVEMYFGHIDHANIYMMPMVVTEGYYYIDATSTSHALVVRTNTPNDVVMETATAEDDEIIKANDSFYFKPPFSYQNKLRYTTEQISNSELQENSTFKTKNVYMMANPARYGLAFMWIDQFGTSRYMPANSLYILGTKTSSARMLNVIWPDGETTDIEEVRPSVSSTDANNTTDAVYTLQGQRVAAPAKPGLYIINGRKTIVR